MNSGLLKEHLHLNEIGLTKARWRLRLLLGLRLMFEADDEGVLKRLTVYQVQKWCGGGTAVVEDELEAMHRFGFLTSDKVTRVIPYKAIASCPACSKDDYVADLEEAQRRGSDPEDEQAFDPDDQGWEARGG